MDDEAVLFHEPAQKLFHLNTMAAVVWCLLDERKSRQDMEADLQSQFSLSWSEAARYVEQTETLFKSLGVLKGFEVAPKEESGRTAANLESVQYDDGSFVAERRYRLLSSRIRQRFTRAEQLALVDPVLQHLRDDVSLAPTVTLDIIEDERGRIVICRDLAPVLACADAKQLVPLVKSLVWQTAINAHDFFLDIHAGVVGDGRQCYLFPGAPGSGKSTLTAALVHHGFEYFSDEIALLQEGSLHVEPVPLALCVKDSGLGVLSRLYPQLHGLTEHLRSDGKRVRYMPPPAPAVPPAKTFRPVGAIIFPSYAPEGRTRLEGMGRIEALHALMDACVIVDTRLNIDKVAGLLGWIEKMPCYRLTMSDLDEAVALMRGLSRELGNRGGQSR